jgi:hypothetical protein
MSPQDLLVQKYVREVYLSYLHFVFERRMRISDRQAYNVKPDDGAIENAVRLWIEKDAARDKQPNLMYVVEQAASLLFCLLHEKPFERIDNPDPLNNDGYKKSDINEQIGLSIALDIVRRALKKEEEEGDLVQADSSEYRDFVRNLREHPPLHFHDVLSKLVGLLTQ